MKNKRETLWEFILKKIEENIPFALLLVLESQGSSPGRQGYKMALATDGEMNGSIGGGIMEHKMVELGHDLLRKGRKDFLLKKQIHDDSTKNRSGMLCSGNQNVLICPFYPSEDPKLKNLFESISKGTEGVLEVSPTTFLFQKEAQLIGKYKFHFESEKNWTYQESLPDREVVNIIGGGHVGLALSRQLSILGFYVKIFDNRPDLNTLEQNEFANEKIIVNYEQLEDHFTPRQDEFVVVMTFSHRSDQIVMRQMIEHDFRYLAMMGSKAKTARMFEELEKQGVNPVLFEKVNAPAGIKIHSKTPEEIAVSIAAQIIQIKNQK